MKLEKLVAQALVRLNDDKYLLANAIGKRSKELSKGVAPMVDMDIKKFKTADIALCEIAEGKLQISTDH